MGFIDKFLNVMNLNPEEDEESEYYDDYDDEYDEEPERVEKPAKRSFFSKKEKTPVEEEVEEPRPRSATTKILPMRHNTRRHESEDMEVCIIKPNSIEDAREITETLMNGRTVLLNMEGVNLDIAQRIMDFTSGSCFALGGNLQKVSGYIFVLTPSNVEISGDVQELLNTYDNSPIQTDL